MHTHTHTHTNTHTHTHTLSLSLSLSLTMTKSLLSRMVNKHECAFYTQPSPKEGLSCVKLEAKTIITLKMMCRILNKREITGENNNLFRD